MKKVVFIATALNKVGGDLISTMRLANAVADDYEVVVVNLAKNNTCNVKLNEKIKIDHIPTFYHYEQFPEEMWNGNKLKLLWFPFLLLRWIYWFFILRGLRKRKIKKRYGNDVIWSYNYMGYLMSPKKRAVFHMHFCHERILGFTEPVLFKTFAKPKAIIALCDTDKAEYEKKFKKFKTYTIGNTLDYDVKPPTFKHNNNKIIFMGRFCKQKRIDRIIKVANVLNQNNADFTMELYGNKKGEGKKMKKQIKKFGLQDKVKLMGHTKEPLKVMSESDILMLTSWFEGGYLNVVLEALAQGCAIATTEWSTSVKELYSPYCVTGEDWEKLAHNLLPILKDKEKLLKVKQSSAKINEVATMKNRIKAFKHVVEDISK